MSHRRYYRIDSKGSLTEVVAPLLILEGKALNNAADGASQVDGTLRFNAKTATPAQKEAWVYKTFQRISDKYDLMNDLESFGLHRMWKHALVRAVTALQPEAVLDVASGTGDIAIDLANANPQARVVGFDFSANMLEVAISRAADRATGRTVTSRTASRAATNRTASRPAEPSGEPRLEFVQGNALAMPFADASFDVVTISFGLRNMSDYQKVIEEMIRVLRPGGCLCCLEASTPTAPLVKPAFQLYFRHLMPLMANLVTQKSAEYRWLNDSTEAFLSKTELAALMRNCGLNNVQFREFALGVAALHIGFKA